VTPLAWCAVGFGAGVAASLAVWGVWRLWVWLPSGFTP